MLLLLATLAASPYPVWWSDFQHAYKRCGVVFNVDGPGPAGDGVLIEEGFTGLVLSSDPHRPQKPIHCLALWAKTAGLKVRYREF